jgi:hypothetical protein
MIREHIYEHVIEYFIQKTGSVIVEEYVGVMCNNGKLGLACVDEGYKKGNELMLSYNSSQCRIIDCQLPWHMNVLCVYHYEQHEDYPITYFHNHECNECVLLRLRTHDIIVRLLTYLNRKISRDVTKMILQFFDFKSLLICAGHVRPKYYTCSLCEQDSDSETDSDNTQFYWHKGGLMQLVAYGEQDTYLTRENSIKFIKYTYEE